MSDLCSKCNTRHTTAECPPKPIANKVTETASVSVEDTPK